MKKSCLLLLNLLLLTLWPGADGWAQALKPRLRQVVTPPSRREKFQLYLVIGQSNMAGRGLVEPQDTVPNRHVLRLNQSGQWEVAQDPMHFDKPVVGVGPGLTFGRQMAAQDTSVTIGLIPCAVGGSGIDSWTAGAYYSGTKTHPYDDALARVAIARQTGTLAGIIWHQGESDSNSAKSAGYQASLKALIEQLRAVMQAPTLPFVAGEMPPFHITKTGSDGQPHVNPDAVRVNDALVQLKTQVPNYACITAAGTVDGGDHIHFDAASARLMGRRYAVAMQELQRKKRRQK